MPNKPIQIAKSIFSGFLDLIYPPFCLVCEQAGEEYLCAQCIETIDVIEAPFCRKCGIPCASYHCSDCQEREYYFEQACSAGVYEGVLKNAIHQLKYKFHIAMADPLAEFMVRSFANTGFRGKFDLVIPIPIHHSRKIERGFNQAEELAWRFCKRRSIVLERDVLYKKKDTKHQANLSQDMRAVNLQGVFAVRNAEKIAGKRILLIDDVFTTGSTLNEAAKALKEAGASTVCAYTLARSL